MTSASRLYRLVLVVGALGLVGAASAAVVALTNITLAPHSSQALWAACRRLVMPQLDTLGIAVLALGLVAATAAALGLRSLARQLHAQHRYRNAIQVFDETRVGDVDVALIDDTEPQAFCAGLLRPRVFVSTGAVERLSRPELEAVIAHECHHQARRDPLRILLARALGDALFFVPAMRRLTRRYEQLAEVAADEAAISAATDRGTLASALLAFGERGTPSIVVGIAPERVDHLLGSTPRWRLPRALLAMSLAAASALLALAFAVAMAHAPGALNLSMLAARSCMLVMVAVPLGLLIAARLTARPLVSRRT